MTRYEGRERFRRLVRVGVKVDGKRIDRLRITVLFGQPFQQLSRALAMAEFVQNQTTVA